MLSRLWQSGRAGLQGALVPHRAQRWAKKATLQTARARLITDSKALCDESRVSRHRLNVGRRHAKFQNWVCVAPRASGFTLVEVLVALLIMSMMAGMAWKGVDGIVRSRDASQARLEQTLRLGTVLAQWEQDLASIQDSTVVPQTLSCDGSSVRMTRRTDNGLQIVVWTLQPEGNGNHSWRRWASPPATTRAALQDSWMRSLQLQGDESAGVRALTGITQRQVYFFMGNDNAWSNCQSSRDATQSVSDLNNRTVANEPLPKGIRLVLTLAQEGGFSGELTRDTVLGP